MVAKRLRLQSASVRPSAGLLSVVASCRSRHTLPVTPLIVGLSHPTRHRTNQREQEHFVCAEWDICSCV
ncbi:hypothetical protein Micbo1qcDRAFT_164013 [Microdochium bolleyi]|uniref:Uncharacterized protein n=1 Tax=Microdochium bolleyi TaxID=196109 RepID=A0A136J049_9PEZI|nr:hypothetical protein Micbo1qcDRAFT_164013 [Microdochium bolleyi]